MIKPTLRSAPQGADWMKQEQIGEPMWILWLIMLGLGLPILALIVYITVSEF